MSRFKPIGHFVYEKGDRIGVTLDEAAVELARKLNAYQMRVERLKAEVEELTGLLKASTYYNTSDEVTRLKAEVERLTKAGDAMLKAIKVTDPILDWKIELWNAAKEGKPQP